jgi:hypothetical protein
MNNAEAPMGIFWGNSGKTKLDRFKGGQERAWIDLVGNQWHFVD